MEVPDKLFLLVSEEEVKFHLKGQTGLSLVFWLFVQTLFLLLFAPLFLAMGYGLPVFWSMCFLLGLEIFPLSSKGQQIFHWNWTGLGLCHSQESKRKQVLLRFFALFTQVKGVSNSVKRRAYLDFILKLFRRCRGRFGKTSIFVLICEMETSLPSVSVFSYSYPCAQVFIEQAWIATAVVVLFNYLLLFQLLALYHAFDYQYLTQLFPLDKGRKRRIETDCAWCGSAVLCWIVGRSSGFSRKNSLVGSCRG